MCCIIEKGDEVIYNGEIHLRKYAVWESLYKHLKKGESYKVKDVITNENGYIYFRLNTEDGDIWYPKESFLVDKRSIFSEKYKLK